MIDTSPVSHSRPHASTPIQFQPGPIPDRLFFRIGDVADLVGIKPYVLRYWETEFPMIAPTKSASGHRVYRKVDVEMVMLIKHLLYDKRFSIEGAIKHIRELKREGVLKDSLKAVLEARLPDPEPVQAAPAPAVAPPTFQIAPPPFEPVRMTAAAVSVVSEEKRARAIQLARELQEMSETPVEVFFTRAKGL